MNLGIINHKEHKEHKEEKDSLSLCSMCCWWLNSILVFIAFVSFSASAQIQQAWAVHYNNGILNGTNQAVKMALDPAGNIYVTGFSQNANSNLGYVTIKYAPNGNQLWASRYDSTNSPTATPSGIILDNSNNVIITGSALTIKYDSNGNQMWTAPYGGNALGVDASNSVYVTGFGTNFNTVKLNSCGSNIWFTTYVDVGPTVSQVLLVDSNANVYIAGADTYTYFGGENGTQKQYYEQLAILKLDSNGNHLWIATDNQNSGSSVHVQSAVLDAANDCSLVFGGDGGGIPVVLQYSSNGKLNWTSFIDLGEDPISTLAVNKRSDIVFAGGTLYGYDADNNFYYYTIVDLNTNGNPMWTNQYPNPPFGSSAVSSIAIDSGNNCYTTGYSSGSNSLNDIVTIAYGPNGNQIWLQRYNGPGNGNDAGNAIAVDNNGNVYVAGYDTTTAGGTEMVLIKYSPLTLKKQTNATFILEAQGSPGESFDIQASTNLQSWLDLGTVTADTNGLMQYADTNASNFPSRFYLTNPQ